MGIDHNQMRIMKKLPDHFFVAEGNLFDTRVDDWSAKPLRTAFACHFQDIETVAQFKATLRAGEYAWPGAYQLAFMAEDGGVICFDCARKEFRNIADSIQTDTRDGWKVTNCIIVDHDEFDVTCEHCNALLAEGIE